MADETSTTEPAQPEKTVNESSQNEDPMKNLKSEFDRKLKNLEANASEKMDALTKANTELLQRLAPQPKPAEPEDDDLWLTDPGTAKENLRKQILAEVRQEAATAQQATQVQQTTYNEMAKSFPELYEPNSPLVRKANEYFSKVAAEQKTDPNVIEASILKAAMEIGLKPVSKRTKSDTDDFVAGSSKKTAKAGGEMPDTMMQFAKLLGQPVDDPKYIERLRKHASRKNWMNYK